jgi:hypothetical protein
MKHRSEAVYRGVSKKRARKLPPTAFFHTTIFSGGAIETIEGDSKKLAEFFRDSGLPVLKRNAKRG